MCERSEKDLSKELRLGLAILAGSPFLKTSSSDYISNYVSFQVASVAGSYALACLHEHPIWGVIIGSRMIRPPLKGTGPYGSLRIVLVPNRCCKTDFSKDALLDCFFVNMIKRFNWIQWCKQ